MPGTPEHSLYGIPATSQAGRPHKNSPRNPPHRRSFSTAPIAHHSMVTAIFNKVADLKCVTLVRGRLHNSHAFPQVRFRQNLANSTPFGKCIYGATVFLVRPVWHVSEIGRAGGTFVCRCCIFCRCWDVVQDYLEVSIASGCTVRVLCCSGTVPMSGQREVVKNVTDSNIAGNREKRASGSIPIPCYVYVTKVNQTVKTTTSPLETIRYHSGRKLPHASNCNT